MTVNGQPVLADSTGRPPEEKWARAQIVILALLATMLFTRDISVGGFRWQDTAGHAMDGVFIHDFVRYSGWRDPIGFAAWHYAHYPGMGLLGYHPPFFATVEAVFFGTFGISIFAARMASVCFGVMGILAAYGVFRRLSGGWTGFVAAVLLAATPMVVCWSRQVMLEMPTLSLLLLATWFFLRFFESPTWGNMVGCALASAAAVLTKQTAAFIFGVLALELLCRRAWWVLRLKKFWVGLLLIAVPVLPYVVLTAEFAPFLKFIVTKGKFPDYLFWANTWSFFLRNLPRISPPDDQMLGWSVTVLLGIGFVLLIIRRQAWPRFRLASLWLLLGYLTVTFVMHKVPRYFFFMTPPVALLAGYALVEMVRAFPWPRVGRAMGAAAVVVILANGYWCCMWLMPDYESTAAMLAEQPSERVILFDGYRDAQFIFAVRRNEETLGQHVVIRASKMFYSCASDPPIAFQEYVVDSAGVLKTLKELGVDYVVLESKEIFGRGTRAGQHLRRMVNDPPFELVRRAPLRTDNPRWIGMTLDTYRVKGAPQPEGRIRLPLPVIGKTLIVSPADLYGPFKPGFPREWETNRVLMTVTPPKPPK